MEPPSDDQLAALEHAFETFARRYKLAEALGPEKPLNELDKLVLGFVARQPGCGPSDIARYLSIANTTVSSATDRLAKRGYLARERSESDRRAVALWLTPAGTARAASLRALYREIHGHMLAPLSEADRETLIGLLRKINSNEG